MVITGPLVVQKATFYADALGVDDFQASQGQYFFKNVLFIEVDTIKVKLLGPESIFPSEIVLLFEIVTIYIDVTKYSSHIDTFLCE